MNEGSLSLDLRAAKITVVCEQRGEKSDGSLCWVDVAGRFAALTRRGLGRAWTVLSPCLARRLSVVRASIYTYIYSIINTNTT